MPYRILFALLFLGNNFIVVPGRAASSDQMKEERKKVDDLPQERLASNKGGLNELGNLLEELKGKTPTEIFNIANNNFHEGNHEQAIETYNVLNTLYPFSEYAEKSKLFIIQALYNSGKMNETIKAIEKFLMFYPASEERELITYLKVKAYFYDQDRILGWLNWVSGGSLIDFSERKDSVQLGHLESEFSRFLEAFPEGKYYEKAARKLKIIQALCIKREWNIAKFYSDRSNYRASYDRLNNVLKKYPKAFEILSSEEAGKLHQLYQDVQQRLALNTDNAA